MKILRLEVCNLASLAANPEQPHVIDFTVSPLKDAGLLAITGATGAGKSTLLDAMCLALFNEVPRLRTAHLGQEGRLADVKDQLSFGDKRNVLSRGAAEGFARVEFQGLDGGRYRAEWRVKRAYLKADGALQAVERSLRDLDHNVVLASKAKECAERIEQLIGMNFDQFTRAVLLAQSEFSTFLKANDGERAALLECLTDSGIYTELGKLSFQKAKIAREAKQQLEAQHGLVTPLDDSARHQLEQQLITQTQACDHLTQQLKLLNEQQAWYQREAEIAQQRDLAQVAQHAAQADWQACRTPRQQVEQRQAVAEVRGDYLRAKSLHSEISLLMQQIADSQQQLGQAEYAVQQASVARQQADLAWQDWQQQLIQLKPRLAQAERDSVQLQHEQQEAQQEEVQFRAAKQAYDQQQIEQQQLQDRLVNQQRTQQHIDEQLFQSQAWATLDELPLAKLIELMQTTVTHHVARQQAQQQYAADQPAQQAAQQQFEQAQQALQQHRTQYGDDLVLQRRVVELHQQKDSTQAQIGQLKDYQQYCQQQDQRQQQLDDLQAEAKQLQQQIEQQQTALQQIEQCVEYSRIEQQSLTKQLQRQRMIQQQSATDLRAVLQPEQPCPVCGSTAHPYAGDLVDSAQLSLAERLLQDSEQQLQQLIEQWQQQQQQQVQQQIALQHLQYALTQCDHSQHSLSEQLAAHAQKKKPLQLQLVAQYGAEQLSQIDALLAQQVANLLPLEQQIEQVIEQQNAREQYRSQLEQAKQMLEQSTLKTTNMQQQIQQASQSAEWASQQFLPQLPAEWQHEWQQAVAQLPVQPVLLSERVAQWQSSIKARRQQLDRRQHIRESVATLQQQLDVMQVVQHNQQQVCSEQQQRLTERQASIDRLTQQIQQILPPDVASVSTWQRQLEQHTTQLTQQQHMSQQQQQQAMQQQQVTQQRIDMQQQRLAECKQERDECAARVLACLQQQPDLSREQLEQLMAITDQQLQQMQQHVQQRQRVLDQADARLEQWQQQMLTHHTQRPTHAQADLIRAYQQQQVDLKNAQEQRAATVAMLQADTEQRQRYQALAQQIVQAETEHQRWAKLAAPIGCATGATFRKIAQGYQLDSLLFYANQQLELFSPRYRLQRAPSSLGLLVIDADLADERRAVHSLSGGESFLVSLALALALAQMASGQMQIESLFIDEGFGSLDPESLQVVMDALDQLQGQGRKVAVITHVQEMQERIPVQIRVERRGSGRSVLRVLG